MKARGLDGKTYPLKLADRVADRRPRSSGHLEARAILLAAFPFDKLHEEVHLPGCGADLYLDFLLLSRRLAVEVQGAQHAKFTPHFHGTPKGFAQARRRDAVKREWCDANGITLLELDDGRRDEWPARVRGAFNFEGEGGGLGGVEGGPPADDGQDAR